MKRGIRAESHQYVINLNTCTSTPHLPETLVYKLIQNKSKETLLKRPLRTVISDALDWIQNVVDPNR